MKKKLFLLFILLFFPLSIVFAWEDVDEDVEEGYVDPFANLTVGFDVGEDVALGRVPSLEVGEENIEGVVQEGNINLQTAKCPSADVVNLRQKAANVKIVYEPYEVLVPLEEDGEGTPEENVGLFYTEFYLRIKIYNLDPSLRVSYTYGEAVRDFYSTDITEEGFISILEPSSDEDVKNVIFDIYGTDTENGCFATLLKKIKLTLPRYNYLSDTEICTQETEFYMCQQFVTFKIDDSKFYDELNRYLKNKEKSGVADVKIQKGYKVNPVISFISTNKLLIISFVLLIGLGVTLYFMRFKLNFKSLNKKKKINKS